MEGNLFTVTCPNCQKKFDVQVTSQSLACPFCNFIGQANFQAPQQYQQQPQQVTQYQQQPQQVIQFQQQPQPEIQFQQQAQPVAVQPPTQKKSRKPLGIILAVIVVIIVVAGAFYMSSTPSSEEENGELKIKRVFHDPQSPGTDDSVDFYAEIVNLPPTYEVEYNVEVYYEGRLGLSSQGDMYNARGSKNLWQHAELFTSTGFDTGDEVRFYVEIFDSEEEPSSDPTPIMTSEIDSFIIG